MSDVDLRVDWCSYEAAKYAVMNWHYSKAMPKSKLNHIGVWENGLFIGAVVFGVGATSDMMMQFDMDKWQGCELVRVALKSHVSPVSRIVSIAVRMLANKNNGLLAIVSYADPEHGHNGAIYQAMNWIYTGITQASPEYMVNGKRWHGRALRHEKPAHLTTRQYLDKIGNYKIITGSNKHRYIYPLNKTAKKKLAPLAKPYPKRDTPLVNGDTLATSQAGQFDSDPEALNLP